MHIWWTKLFFSVRLCDEFARKFIVRNHKYQIVEMPQEKNARTGARAKEMKNEKLLRLYHVCSSNSDILNSTYSDFFSFGLLDPRMEKW